MSREGIPPATVLEDWQLSAGALEPLGSGLINRTWLVTGAGGRCVLQQLNPVFPASINADIDAVTAHLARRGMPTPRLLRNRHGALWSIVDGRCWRVLTWMPGVAPDAITGPGMAREAGELLGRFHAALADCRHEFSAPRSGIHDTARHFATLRAALAGHAAHPAHAQVAALADSLFAAAAQVPALPARLPARIVHGDPKLNNLLFDAATGKGCCLVDLDTLGQMAIPLELGDALRSWCNPGGEDRGPVRFSIELFEAALRGYAASSRGLLIPAEYRAIVPAAATIMLELAARFAADALNDRYFGWDPRRFASRSVHNLARARGQFELFNSFWPHRDAAAGLVEDIFSAEGR
jgi:Ser/Thr protein kinase RdoA (MazF antagonist)